MTSANRLQLSMVRETTPGTTPASPRMRKWRNTGESLVYDPTYVDSDEIRDDRMLNDPIKTMQAAGGGINFELSYPDDLSPLSEAMRGACENDWVNTPTFFNDGTADSIVTDAGTVANTYAVVSGGAAVKANMLVRATGFTNAANNQVFPAASSTGTTVVGTGLGLVAEVAPPATAKLKVVGLQGASGDITALADGLGSTTLDYTTMGLAVGQWVKIGGTADATTFAFLVTAGAKSRNAAYARVTAIAAAKLTLDNLPAGWTTDSGAGKTIRVFFGDQIRNGVLQTSMTIEKGFLGQAVPSYVALKGMQVNQFGWDAVSGDKIKGTMSFMGMGGGISTTPLDAVPDPVTTGVVMAGNANVGRIGVNGAQLGSPNWAKGFTFQIDNGLRNIEAVDDTSPVGINNGDSKASGKLTNYFGSMAEVQAFFDGTPRPLNSRILKNGQVIITQIPRATYRGGGNPQATAKNTDVMTDFDWQASQDLLTNAQILFDRFEYVE
jgi:hypothetical protein